MLDEPSLEKVSQYKNSNKRKEKINFQENISKVLSFTLYFISCFLQKGWIPMFMDIQRSKD